MSSTPSPALANAADVLHALRRYGIRTLDQADLVSAVAAGVSDRLQILEYLFLGARHAGVLGDVLPTDDDDLRAFYENVAHELADLRTTLSALNEAWVMGRWAEGDDV